jgi:hypothetical protein
MHAVSTWLWDVLRAMPPQHAPVIDDPESFRLQILVTPIERGQPPLTHVFRPDAEYFYPASSIKFLAAAASLCFIEELRRAGVTCDEHTPLAFHPLFADQHRKDKDPSNLDGGTITLAHQCRKTLIVSDNPAFNYMYELLGHRGLNQAIAATGLRSCAINHRLSEFRSPQDQVRTRAVDLLTPAGVHHIPAKTSDLWLSAARIPGLNVGRAYVDADRRIDQPMPFALKNRISLKDLHHAMLDVARPDLPRTAGHNGFPLTDHHRALLVEGMTLLPRQSRNPIYASAEYTDDYVKPMLPGLTRVVASDDLTIISKIGWAYGFIVENAIVSARGKDTAFALTACMFVCRGGVLNIDEYEYDSIAKPFLADLAEVIARRIGW